MVIVAVLMMINIASQVPLELAPKFQRTVARKGCEFVPDDIGRAEDVKRFATLNLTIPMHVAADGGNLPVPHIIFAAKKHTCTPASEWSDQEEVAQYAQGVLVSFQENVRDVFPALVVRLHTRYCYRAVS